MRAGQLPIIGRNVRKRRLVRLGLATTAVAVTGILLAACNYLIPDQPKNQSPNVLDQVQSLDLLPRNPKPSESGTTERTRTARAVVYNGSTESADNAPAVTVDGAEPAANGEGYDLNFDNAPITTVAKVILGDILGAGYVIDPRVRGTITLTSGRPVPKSDVLYVLESALRVGSFSLVHDTGGYRIVPGNDAVATGGIDIVTPAAAPNRAMGSVSCRYNMSRPRR